MMAITETITGVAILTEDGALWALPKPNRHHHIFALAALTGKPADPGTQGFTTSFARFVDRKEALSLAKASNQILESQSGNSLNELYSEDLW